MSSDASRPYSSPPPSPSRRVAQAIDALRHGWPVGFVGGPVMLAAETALASGANSGRMLISDARAQTLKLANQRDAAEPHSPVLIEAGEPFSLDDARAIADPSLDLTHPLKGPFRAVCTGDDAAIYSDALELARIAGILPAFLLNPSEAGEPVWLEPSDLAAWQPAGDLTIAARASLPVSSSVTAQILAFRSTDDLREHAALIIGNQTSDHPPLVRVHSECLTGDVFGSLKCDCGPQLDAALGAMSSEAGPAKADSGEAGHEAAGKSGWSILLYLRQEGRGIGLINKLRAYRLQDQGFDTVDANQRLGLPDEARDFAVAARMLDLLCVDKIRLMTNNPAKVDALVEAGINVAERVPHSLPDNPFNARYLATKRDRSGHLLP